MAGSCEGASFIATATIQPEPVLTPGLFQTICTTSITNLTLTTINTLPGTTFTYAAPVKTGGMTGGTARAVGTADPITDPYTNNTTEPQTATYSVIPEAGNGCVGDATDVVIIVNPLGQVYDPGTRVFCNAAAATVGFITVNTGGFTTYEWTNSNPAIGLAASGIGDLDFIATNPGTSPISALIFVTPTFTNAGQSCVGPTVTFTIIINPTGQVNPTADQ